LYFSNRSAAYLKQGDANNALSDANACIGLAPDFAKGYSRKGAALHALKRYNDSIAAYQQGLEKFPTDAGLQQGLADVEREKENPYGAARGGGGAAGGLFSPQMMAQMALNPRLRPFLADAQIMAKIKMVQQNPNLLPTILQDPQMMEMLEVMMGDVKAEMGDDDNDDDNGDNNNSKSKSNIPRGSPPKKESSKPTPMEVEKEEEAEEDWSHLSPQERQVKENQKAAVKRKEEGNNLYKAKKFKEALAAYDAAIALDPTSMTYLSNKAAVYFAQKDWDECINMCLQAVQVGKDHRAPFEERGKALTRAAKAYQKKGDLGKAIELCQEAQLENYDKETQRLLKTMELEKKKADALSYQDDEKAELAKQRGNEAFRASKWSLAVQEYEEAVKRAPKNAAIRNNLAAALCKIMDFAGAQRQIEVAIEIDPKYVKAWIRKGDIESMMKEYHKAMESYKEGLELDPDNVQAKDGLRKTMAQINYGRHNMTDEEKKQQAEHSMADPQIQAILHDPVMQQVLKDFREQPQAAQQALKDPVVRAKIEKLIAAGIIETR
jgi:stress-induced-phosphoprotein 1